jgi:hypothetical protein
VERAITGTMETTMITAMTSAISFFMLKKLLSKFSMLWAWFQQYHYITNRFETQLSIRRKYALICKQTMENLCRPAVTPV